MGRIKKTETVVDANEAMLPELDLDSINEETKQEIPLPKKNTVDEKPSSSFTPGNTHNE